VEKPNSDLDVLSVRRENVIAQLRQDCLVILPEFVEELAEMFEVEFYDGGTYFLESVQGGDLRLTQIDAGDSGQVETIIIFLPTKSLAKLFVDKVLPSLPQNAKILLSGEHQDWSKLLKNNSFLCKQGDGYTKQIFFVRESKL
jgi:hypothetical protein